MVEFVSEAPKTPITGCVTSLGAIGEDPKRLLKEFLAVANELR
jgi:hypothetical protein